MTCARTACGGRAGRPSARGSAETRAQPAPRQGQGRGRDGDEGGSGGRLRDPGRSGQGIAWSGLRQDATPQRARRMRAPRFCRPLLAAGLDRISGRFAMQFPPQPLPVDAAAEPLFDRLQIAAGDAQAAGAPR